MMLAAVETVAKTDPVWVSRRHNSDIAAQATAGESVHTAILWQTSLVRMAMATYLALAERASTAAESSC